MVEATAVPELSQAGKARQQFPPLCSPRGFLARTPETIVGFAHIFVPRPDLQSRLVA